jgi:hypothetical protein
MSRRSGLPAAFVALAALAVTGGSARAQAKARADDERDRPHDLILAVDVSLSMIGTGREKVKGVLKTFPPNDREGLRWDGLQFTLDVAGDDDRVALVLYRAQSKVVTEELDPSGFVRLAQRYPRFGNRTGRELLSDVVAQLQELEKRWVPLIEALERRWAALSPQQKQRTPVIEASQFLEYSFSLPTAGGARVVRRFSLEHGTGSLLTLDRIKRQLLPAVRPDPARAWVFLFTDGVDNVGPVAEREAREGKRLDAWVAARVGEFRKKNAPLFTFALGKFCDWPMLESLAVQSTPPGRQALPGASYRPETNDELLRSLQRLQWELREHWQRKLPAQPRPREREAVFTLPFTTPPIHIWRDIGVLLYRLPNAPRGQQAQVRAPLGDTRLVWGDGQALAGVMPRKSPSYWYYALSPDDPALAPLPRGKDTPLHFVVNTARPGQDGGQTQCVAALRTLRPLFELRQPAAGTTFTPRDGIPFEVVFTPYALPRGEGRPEFIPFEARDFKVSVTLTPAHRPGVAPKPLTFALVPVTPKVADPKAPVRFTATRVLDDDPGGGDTRGLSGLYFVDVEIVGVDVPGRLRPNPLQDAVRRLVRRTLEVGPYPGVKVAPASVHLTNEGAGSLAAEVRVELDMPTDPEDVPTRLDVRTVRQKASDKGQLAPELFEVAPKTVVLKGRSGTFKVTLPATALAGLKEVGDHAGVALEVKAHWQRTAAVIPVTVRKGKYKVSANPPLIRLDLSARGGGKGERQVEVALGTGLEARERVWLSPSRDLYEKPRGLQQFTQIEDEQGRPLANGPRVAFQVSGLGPDGGGEARKAEARPQATLSFALAPVGKLAAGVYQRQLYLVGPGVETVPLTVKVVVNQVRVLDGAGRALDDVSLLGLAGTEVNYPLTFKSALAARPLKKVAIRPGWGLLENPGDGVWDRLPLRVKSGAKAEQMVLGLSVPRCVQEGVYRTELTFEVVSGEGKTEQTSSISLPVQVEVRHKGVRSPPEQLDAKGAFWLGFKGGKAAPEFAARELTLQSDATRAPVRWSVERVAAGPGPGTALDPADGRLEVLFKGTPILTTGAGGGKDPSKVGGPRDPIDSRNPCTLTVKVWRKKLDPGLYRAALRFRSREDRKDAGEGLVNDLQVHVVVPGRGELSAARADAAPLYLGGEARVRVQVAGYDSPPGQGSLRLLDAKGEPAGPPVALAEPVSSAAADVPGKKVHRYEATVTLPRAGKNVCEVRWPKFRTGDGPAEDVLRVELPLEARGVIRAAQQVVGVNEEVLLQATIDPARRPEGSGPVVLRLIEQSDRDRELTVPLFDDGKPENGDERAGDGVYSAKYQFPAAGTYEVVSPEEGGPGPLKPVVVHVSYELRPPDRLDRLGTIEYGGGDWLRWLGIREEVDSPGAVQLKNWRPERCRWRARLLFPKGGLQGRQLTARNAGSVQADPTPDPRVHLDAKLTGPAAGKGGPGWALSGELQKGEEVDLGVEARLPQAALDEVQGNSAPGEPHPVLGKSSAMLLEVEMEWLDDRGQVVERRNVRLPLSVNVRPWTQNPTPWVVGIAALVALFVGARVLLRLFRRGRRPPEPAPAGAAAAAVTTAAPAPERPREGPPPRPAAPRSAGDEDIPEHMR